MRDSRFSLWTWCVHAIVPWRYRRTLCILSCYGLMTREIDDYEVAYLVLVFDLRLQGDEAIRTTKSVTQWLKELRPDLHETLSLAMESQDPEVIWNHITVATQKLPSWMRYANLAYVHGELSRIRQSVMEARG